MLTPYGKGRKRACLLLGAWCLSAPAFAGAAPQAPVTVQVEIMYRPEAKRQGTDASQNASNVAVWLTPQGGPAQASPAPANRPAPQLVQRNKTFAPRVVVVQAGATVQFPNQDPFFHNVFSLFAGKRFDLGLYQAGTSRSIRFDRPGVSFLFCNIHPQMSAAVVVVPTPYYALSDASGRVTIGAVPNGRYQLQVWHERSSPEDLKSLGRSVIISDSTRSLGPIRIFDNGNITLTHKNKYGQDYVPPPERAGY
jgi:plastocyanin